MVVLLAAAEGVWAVQEEAEGRRVPTLVGPARRGATAAPETRRKSRKCRAVPRD